MQTCPATAAAVVRASLACNPAAIAAARASSVQVLPSRWRRCTLESRSLSRSKARWWTSSKAYRTYARRCFSCARSTHSSVRTTIRFRSSSRRWRTPGRLSLAAAQQAARVHQKPTVLIHAAAFLRGPPWRPSLMDHLSAADLSTRTLPFHYPYLLYCRPHGVAFLGMLSRRHSHSSTNTRTRLNTRRQRPRGRLRRQRAPRR